MREIDLRTMQLIELDLFRSFAEVCRQYKLRYYMDGGTLLGAMCYEGFIPWDDDIDLKMPRPDYEKLLTLQHAFPAHIRLDAPSREHCEYTMLKLIDDRTVLREHANGMTKETGVYLDVFPMDGHPKDPAEAERHIRTMQRYNSLFHASLDGFAAMRRSASPVARCKGLLYRLCYTPWRLYRRMTAEACRYAYDEADEVGLLVEGNAVKERFSKDWLQPGFELPFEGSMFSAPSGYKRHMEIFYGSHVTKPEYHHNLPRIDSSHQHEVYLKDGCEL